jgi:hypothetical protein
MGELCRLFSRTTEFNISIYVIAIIFISLCGSFWIYGMQQQHPSDQKLWKDRAMITGIVGVITVSVLAAANMTYYELSFNKKCDILEKYINRQFLELKERFRPDRLASEMAGKTSRAVAETLVTEFKNQFGRAVADQLKTELSNASGLSGVLNAMK